MSFVPSKYQKAIFEFVENGAGNAVVNAVAGSGKTTTIVNALKMIPKEMSVCFLAFNKSIVNELKQRVPDHVNVQTLHSLGWTAMGRAYNRPQLNGRKIQEVIIQRLPLWADVDPNDKEYGGRVAKLVDLLRVDLCETPEELERLAVKHEVEIYNGECTHAFDVILHARQDKSQFDFTDMLYMPCIDENITMFKYDWIFVDECQDLNRAQQKLMTRIMKPNTRFIAVGDPQQAIYGFAGADVHSFTNLTQFPNTIQLPLSVNYRCGTNIINFAKAIVPHLEAFDGAIEGIVNHAGLVADIQDGDMVLCRNTAPLVQLCLEFIAKGRKATVKGSDIGKNLINLVKKTKSRNLNGIWTALETELAKVYRKLALRRPQDSQEDIMEMPSYRLLSEKIVVLRIIADQSSSVTSPDTLIAKIEKIFGEELEGIVLSTIHKAKGLESNNVFIIEKALMPSKYAKQPWQMEQERNLMYVAYTRAKKVLSFVSDWSYNRDREVGLNNRFKRRQEISREITAQLPNTNKTENNTIIEPIVENNVNTPVPQIESNSTLDLSKIKGRKNQVKALLDKNITNINTIAEMIGTHPSYVQRLVKEINNN